MCSKGLCLSKDELGSNKRYDYFKSFSCKRHRTEISLHAN